MHTIRLRGPWQRRLADQQEVRVNVPDPVGSASSATADPECVAWYVRKFNRPTGLESQHRVYLSVTQWSGQLEAVLLNGQPIAIANPPLRADVTTLLQPHNRLELKLLADPSTSPRLSGEVALLIEHG